MNPRWVGLTVVVGLLLGGCGEAQTVPPGTPPGNEQPYNLACVERAARADATVQTVETKAPARGPAGAAGYVKVRFKRGGSVTITEWRDRAAEGRAVMNYQSLRYSLEARGKSPRGQELIAFPPTLPAGDPLKFASSCD